MAIHKKDEFTKKENELADFANAISHPARVAILKEIAKRETRERKENKELQMRIGNFPDRALLYAPRRC